MLLKYDGVERQSRFGPVLMSPSPVTTVYAKPTERVVFWPERDANPFFHFYESLWMLGGRDDIASLTRFVARMKDFSDDGVTHYGAYGRRWRVGMPAALEDDPQHQDQLIGIASTLHNNPDDRRQVLQMWDARSDLGHHGVDVPCNVTATFQVNAAGELCMSVFNRSNDIIWGCYGANAVHFSYLLEYVACRAGLKVGTYHQISINWHGYRKTFDPLLEAMKPLGIQPCPYELDQVRPYPLMQDNADIWDFELQRFLKSNGRAPIAQFSDPFFQHVALPIVQAHDAYKDGTEENRYEAALGILGLCHASDWRKACEEWIRRRWIQHRKAVDDGVTT